MILLTSDKVKEAIWWESRYWHGTLPKHLMPVFQNIRKCIKDYLKVDGLCYTIDPMNKHFNITFMEIDDGTQVEAR